MAEDRMLREAVEAIAQGQRARARDLLTRLLRADQANPIYWLYMSAVVESSKERIYCLKNVLRLDPQNKQAQLGLVILGAIPPPPDLSPVQIPPRDWDQTQANKSMASAGKKMLRIISFGGAGLLLIGLLLVGTLKPGYRLGGIFGLPHLTVTPKFAAERATATLLPTNTPYQRTPTPTFIGPTPLWMLLEATYTPTPLYVNTPHPISEAFRAGLRAFGLGEYEDLLKYMQQAAREEPQAADAYYYVGEAYRLLDEPEQALAAYDQAIQADSGFAPAYLGRARANIALFDMAEVEQDLLRAVELDPNLLEGFLELASLKIAAGEIELALDYLEAAEGIAPSSPLIYQYRAEAFLASEDNNSALAAAEIAYKLDRTSLPIYKVLGQAYLEVGEPARAKEFLDIYLSFVEDDVEAQVVNGRILYELHDFAGARDALSKVLELQDDLFPALLYRGLAYLELKEGQLAVNDLFAARNIDRQSFLASLGLGRALLLTNRFTDAISQFSGSEELAEEEDQLAAVYYWRALAREAAGDTRSAISDWNALLALPREVVPPEWRSAAAEKILLLTPSPTMINTIQSPTPSPTITPSVASAPAAITPTAQKTQPAD